MINKSKHQLLNFLIASGWLVNGLFCKVFNLVPRHQLIVARILGDQHARTITILIGISETLMAAWIITGHWKRFNAITQIIIIASMNALEFFLAPGLLLWGKANAAFAIMFILLIYYNEFHLNKTPDT